MRHQAMVTMGLLLGVGLLISTNYVSADDNDGRGATVAIYDTLVERGPQSNMDAKRAAMSDEDVVKAIKTELKNSDLSTVAQNVQISTEGGKVVIRGNVRSADENHKVEKFVRRQAGNRRVQNELEILR